MKNLFKSLPFLILVLCAGLGCRGITDMVESKNCAIGGQPDPITSDDFVKRGGLHLDKNNFAPEYVPCAYSDFDRAVRLDERNVVAYDGRGLMLLYNDKLDEAKADFDKAIALDPTYSIAYLRRSQWHQKKGDLDSAIRDMSKTIELVPVESDYARRAELYELKGDTENAAKDYTFAIDEKNDGTVWRDSKEYLYYQLRAAAYRKLGKEDLAKQDDDAVKKLNEKYNDIGAALGDKPARNGSTKVGGTLNKEALSLAQPAYPAAAKAVKASGKVIVKVTVAKDGSVASAQAVSGHPLLKTAAVKAAMQAKFKPGPSSVSGTLEYEFTL